MRSSMGFGTPTTPTTSLPSPPPSSSLHSPWHSPVPYLFGGFAAMLGLIAFALLILACSYWKLSSYLDDDAVEEDNNAVKDAEVRRTTQCYEEKIVVIMAGDQKPTFLALPISSRASSFNDCQGREEENGNEETNSQGDQEQ